MLLSPFRKPTLISRFSSTIPSNPLPPRFSILFFFGSRLAFLLFRMTVSSRFRARSTNKSLRSNRPGRTCGSFLSSVRFHCPYFFVEENYSSPTSTRSRGNRRTSIHLSRGSGDRFHTLFAKYRCYRRVCCRCQCVHRSGYAIDFP